MTTIGGPAPPIDTVKLQSTETAAQIDNLISLNLHLWPALSAAIQNGWGTSSPEVGEDKRAWLAGALSDMFAQNQLRDTEDVEDVLEQVMNEEFEVVVDDGSLEEVARKIWTGRTKILSGDASEVVRLMGIWEEKQNKGKSAVAITQGPDVNQETDDEEDEETWNGFQDTLDVDMDDAPTLVDARQPRPKAEPEVDEDGFTKVIGKKKR